MNKVIQTSKGPITFVSAGEPVTCHPSPLVAANDAYMAWRIAAEMRDCGFDYSAEEVESAHMAWNNAYAQLTTKECAIHLEDTKRIDVAAREKACRSERIREHAELGF